MRKIKMAMANEKTFAQGCEEFINIFYDCE
jgi:hypothetical protein